MSKLILELKNISKFYPEISGSYLQIFQDINLSVSEGEKIAIIGESGVGKSSLLNIASLLDDGFTGEIFFLQEKIAFQSQSFITQIRLKNFGFVYQDHSLLPEFNAYENVALPLLIQGYKQKYAFNLAKDMISKLGLTNRVNHLPGEISGGERQRLAVARALVSTPKIIFADEPTGSLDFKNANNVGDLFCNIVNEYNAALIVATHNIEFAKKMDRIFKLDNMTLKQIF